MQYMLVTSERLLSKGVPLNDISIFYSSQGVIVVIFVFLLLYYPSNMVCGFDFEKWSQGVGVLDKSKGGFLTRISEQAKLISIP